MHCVEYKFRKAVTGMISLNSRVLVAVSGGPDSIVLLHLFKKLSLENPNIKLAIAHLNHLSRGEDSNKDSVFVVELGKKTKLDTFVEAIDVSLLRKNTNTSFQESARLIRYDFLRRIFSQWKGDLIALGHNADDQAETVLINLLRGSGLLGLTGIRAQRDIFIRPLHGCFRSEIDDYIHAHDLKYCSDETNFENKYLRNKVRLELIPFLELYNPKIKSILTVTSAILTDDEDYLVKQVDEKLIEVDFRYCENSYTSLDIKLLNSQHPAMQKRLVRHAIFISKGNLRSISVRHILEILRLVKCGVSSKEIHLPNDLVALFVDGKLTFCNKSYVEKVVKKKSSVVTLSARINVPGFTDIGFRGLGFNVSFLSVDDFREFSLSPNIAYFDYHKTGPNLKMRLFRPGDNFIPLGMKGRKKIKSFFIDEKIDQDERKLIPFLTTENDFIIWIYEKRIGENYRVTDKTSVIVKIEGVMQPAL
jgi:tRNA(Ile)-lysidine synthase